MNSVHTWQGASRAPIYWADLGSVAVLLAGKMPARAGGTPALPRKNR